MTIVKITPASENNGTDGFATALVPGQGALENPEDNWSQTSFVSTEAAVSTFVLGTTVRLPNMDLQCKLLVMEVGENGQGGITVKVIQDPENNLNGDMIFGLALSD